jgi:preprotein translocase subunit SecY
MMTVLTLTTGTAFIMWLGEQITERGIGNGMSLIIFAGIVVGFPRGVIDTFQMVQRGELSLLATLILLAAMFLVVAAIVFVERGQRRIPVQYAKRVVGRRVYGGQTTHLPLRVNTAGVIPVIFASSLLALPMGLFSWASSIWPDASWLRVANEQLQWRMPLYDIAYVLLIIFFCFFYTSIVFNPMDTAENMKRVGGFIPGVRPGKTTAQYIDSVLTRLTTSGAIYLAAISMLPIFLLSGIPLDKLRPAALGEFFARVLPGWVLNGTGIQFYFGGTSLLIVIGVAMDTIQQVESQLVMRHYDGFLKGTRIKGRRG